MDTEGLIGGHTAFLVPSIDKSRAHLESTLSLSFDPPANVPFEFSGAGEPYEQTARVCFTSDRRLELIEATEEGLFAAVDGYGLHHYGGAVAEIEDAVSRQRSAGNEVKWELSHDGQLIAVFFKGADTLPGSLELVSAKAPPLLELFAESS